MQRGALARNRVSTGLIGTALVLLVGVLVLAYGHFNSNVAGLFVGLLLTAYGVLRGTLQIVILPKH
jgi:hypothetical protein